jgi:hypothetical protein
MAQCSSGNNRTNMDEGRLPEGTETRVGRGQQKKGGGAQEEAL